MIDMKNELLHYHRPPGLLPLNPSPEILQLAIYLRPPDLLELNNLPPRPTGIEFIHL